MFHHVVLLASIGLIPEALPRAATPQGDVGRDIRHTIAARKLLASDPDLAPWNIGVIVRDRVAILWGPVPSAEIAFRAEVRVRLLIELADVKNELFVSDTIEPMRVLLRINNPPRMLPGIVPPPSLPADPRLKTPMPAPIQVLPPEVLPPPGFDRKRLP